MGDQVARQWGAAIEAVPHFLFYTLLKKIQERIDE
jgi:hypothetical protein